MAKVKAPSNALLLVLIVGLCSFLSARAAQQRGAEPKVMTLTPGKQLVFDFAGSPNGGVSAGNFNNFAFGLDLQQPIRKIAIRPGEQRKDVIATYDYADCTKGQERLLEAPLGELAGGSATWVDYVDIEMMPFPQKDLKWEGGVCYGYRNPQKVWHWHLTTTPLTYDAGTNRVRARIWVKEANIDALKLVFDASVPRQYVRTVTVTTQPTKLQTSPQ
jgi:hypothetical protein